jgi:hypothetical protein
MEGIVGTFRMTSLSADWKTLVEQKCGGPARLSGALAEDQSVGIEEKRKHRNLLHSSTASCLEELTETGCLRRLRAQVPCPHLAGAGTSTRFK